VDGTDVHGGRGSRRVTRAEIAIAGSTALILLALVIAEPKIVEAPFENWRTVVFTGGCAIVAGAAFAVMVRRRVPPAVRVLVVGVPLIAVTWWLISPFFIDDVVDDDFATSISAAAEGTGDPAATTVVPPATKPVPDPSSPAAPPPVDPAPPSTATTVAPPPSDEPVLRGSGTIRGLAGHRGTGDAGIFALADGTNALRLENLDIQNGPNLQLYVVRGADQREPIGGSLHLGALRGNVGNLTYAIPNAYEIAPGDWTVLVWCEAFSVEFVAATLAVD
jgi:hypothetical protein